MDPKKIQAKYAPIINATMKLVYKGVNAVNYQPHRFVLSNKHIAYAHKYNNNKLDPSVLARHACGECGLPYDQHTHDVVIMVSLTQNMTRGEFNQALEAAQAIMEADGLKGFVLVDTPEKFRVI